jgi:hydroxyquinol 1,2-dioxygenase
MLDVQGPGAIVRDQAVFEHSSSPATMTLMEDRITPDVLASLERAPDPRARRVLESLIHHLHAFAREVALTDEEWLAGIRFLTAAGQKCDERRQEFILISDVLGLSMLVDAINHGHAAGATEGTVLGPFHVEGAREIANGDDLAAGWPGETRRWSAAR